MGHCVAIVCDFFYPRLGGVEMHIWQISKALIQRGHKVIVLTHAYGKRAGVRYISTGLKVYYLPMIPFVDQVIFPTFYSWLPLFRNIVIRERVTIVHGHTATSCMAQEALLMASALGITSCYTDHSLFGFHDVASILINHVLQSTLSDIGAAICVSNACRENLCLRASLAPDLAFTIPNAIDPSRFLPATALERRRMLSTGRIVVVSISRLVYRKGADILAQVIPMVCSRCSQVSSCPC